MSRPLRVEYNGAYYHVLSRGNNRCNIFRSNKDYNDFIEILEELADRFSIDIFAYILMTNHYHLLLRTRKRNLSRAMQWMGTTYTRRFNNRNRQTGHLFQGRFKSILIENDAYCLNLSLYLHRNPLRAKMVKSLADYKWSSYPFYAYNKKSPKWLNTDLILSQCRARKDRHRAYREMVQKYSDENESFWKNIKFGFIYGSQTFIGHIKETYLPESKDHELPHLNRLLKAQDPEVLLSKAAELLNCDIDDFKRAGRLTGKNRDKRDVIAWLLKETGRYSNQAIGDLLGLTYSSVSRRLTQVRLKLKATKNSKVKEFYNFLNTKIKV